MVEQQKKTLVVVRTQINWGLLLWCTVVAGEFFVIAVLTGMPFLVLCAGILFWPVRDAFAWPLPPAEVSVAASDSESRKAADKTLENGDSFRQIPDRQEHPQ